MLQWFKADLHVHTCLSPCGDVTMSPRRIIAEARRRGLDVIAITDHNSAENVPAVMRAAEGTTIAVIPGMEICSNEDVHVLALFGSLPSAWAMQETVYGGISQTNDPDAFGLQVIANEHDEVEGFQDKLLIGATDLSIGEVVERIHDLNGLAIASHIDRESFGIVGQLGFIPEGLPLDALEISSNASRELAGQLQGGYGRYVFIRSSDAHSLDRIGEQTTRFFMDSPVCEEIGRAIRREEGRAVATDEQNPGAV